MAFDGGLPRDQAEAPAFACCVAEWLNRNETPEQRQHRQRALTKFGWRTDANGTTSVSGRLAVYTHDEEGLQGVGVDPGFATNRHIYLFYAPPLNTPGGDAPATGSDFSAWKGVNRLARFTLNADYTLNLGSQVTVLEVATDRGMCCHVGGDIDFDAAGNLYLSTGDDSNPFDSGGYTPIDERTNRNPTYDAQRSAGNTNDLRGKVLRIKVKDGDIAPAEANIGQTLQE